jgi:farnesyl diphosphate synthase
VLSELRRAKPVISPASSCSSPVAEAALPLAAAIDEGADEAEEAEAPEGGSGTAWPAPASAPAGSGWPDEESIRKLPRALPAPAPAPAAAPAAAVPERSRYAMPCRCGGGAAAAPPKKLAGTSTDSSSLEERGSQPCDASDAFAESSACARDRDGCRAAPTFVCACACACACACGGACAAPAPPSALPTLAALPRREGSCGCSSRSFSCAAGAAGAADEEARLRVGASGGGDAAGGCGGDAEGGGGADTGGGDAGKGDAGGAGGAPGAETKTISSSLSVILRRNQKLAMSKFVELRTAGGGVVLVPAGAASASAQLQPSAFYGTREGFVAVYEELKAALLAGVSAPGFESLPHEAVRAHLAAMLDYNVPGGKLNRGLTVVHALQSVYAESNGGAECPAREAKLAAVLGWCIEWLQAFFLVADDIMDASVTRRGQPCWFRLPHVGMVAINDAFLLQANLFRVLREYFGEHPAYVQLLELFNETTFQTELGQLLDLTSQPQPATGEPIDLDRFTLQRYRAIVEFKTAYYSFYLPVACALVLGGRATPATLAASREILVVMGEYFQVQDDYLDCYADAETLGKIGTDIQDNKCGWLVVQAMARCSPAQLALLKADYGRHDDAAVARVKALYRELDLERVFKAYEDESYARLQEMIADRCARVNLPEDVFKGLLAKIYKRSK